MSAHLTLLICLRKLNNYVIIQNNNLNLIHPNLTNKYILINNTNSNLINEFNQINQKNN